MKSLLTVILLACLPICARAADDNAAKDRERLQGVWQLVSMEIAGEKPPTEEMLKNMKLTIKGNTMSHSGSRPEDKANEGTFKLDPTTSPKSIDLVSTSARDNDPDKGKVLSAIYSLDGDDLRICVAEPGNERPKELKPGKSRVLMVFKREKP